MIDTTVSHYKILEKLGEGGMGVVYRARDTKLDRDVALKFLSAQLIASEKEKQRFAREAKAVAALNHPNICTIHDVDEHNGRQFIVMEYIEGSTLREKMRESGLEVQMVCTYAVQILKALKEAHSKEIIHRDIKCNNIMVTPDDRIKIMDFGLAKLKGSDPVTRTGKTVGTITTMSPEQVRGEEADQRSDIWSFGVVLYEMLTGVSPFKEDYEHAVMYSILNEDPPPVSSVTPSLPRELEEIVSRCIAKAPSERYQNVSDPLEDLHETMDRTSSLGSTRAAGGQMTNVVTKRNATVAGTLILSVGVLIFAIFAYNSSTEQNAAFEGAEDGPIRLTVLPIKNIGDDPSRQVFCDGLSETITSNLTNHEDLWVVPAADVRKLGVTSPGEVHKRLGVKYAVTGSLQPIGDQLRLTINLVNVENPRQVGSRVIDEDASNIPDLHERSVENVLSMLNVEFPPDTRQAIKAGQSAVSPAFEKYIEGIGHLQRYDRIENINDAIDSFKQSIELDPEFALAHAGLGQAYWRKYDYTRETNWLEQAEKEARAALEINSDLTEVNITMGVINTAFGRYEEAVEIFNDVLASDPTNADAYRELAWVYESLGEIEKAESTLKRSIQLKPDYWVGHNRLGAMYLDNNQFEHAIEKFKKVIELTPDNYTGYMNLGITYYKLGRYDDARSMFEKSLDLEETYDASSNLATLYYREGRYKEAARMFETALELRDSNYLLWGNLGSAYYWAPGEREKAKEAFERAIELAKEQKEINPNDPLVSIDLAGYQAKIGDEEKARDNIETALELAPDNTLVMFIAGTAYEQMGDREEALHWIEKAIEHGHSKSEIMNQPDLQDLISDERFQRLIED
ncbi:MAG: protein kinase [Bacteroidetes bacterium]|jgi:serine/threonine-protein kinase|nr:protein kinase [Bacteroidota bacterium]